MSTDAIDLCLLVVFLAVALVVFTVAYECGKQSVIEKCEKDMDKFRKSYEIILQKKNLEINAMKNLISAKEIEDDKYYCPSDDTYDMCSITHNPCVMIKLGGHCSSCMIADSYEGINTSKKM